MKFSTAQQSKMVAELCDLVRGTLEEQAAIDRDYEVNSTARRERFESESAELSTDFQTNYDALKAEYLDKLVKARHDFESQRETIEKDVAKQHAQAQRQLKRSATEAKLDWALERRGAVRSLDENHQQALAAHKQDALGIKQQRAELEEFCEDVTDFLAQRGYETALEEIETVPAAADSVGSLQRFQAEYQQCQAEFQNLRRTVASRFLSEYWAFGVWFLLLLVLIVPAVFMSAAAPVLGGLASFGIAVICAALLQFIFTRRARHEAMEDGPRVMQLIVTAKSSLESASTELRQTSRDTIHRLKQRHAEDMAAMDKRWQSAISQFQEHHDRSCKQLAAWSERKRETNKEEWAENTRTTREAYVPMLEEKERDFVVAKTQLQLAFENDMSHLTDEREARWSELRHRWSNGNQQFADEVGQLNAFCDEMFPAWTDDRLLQIKQHSEALPAVRLGEYSVKLTELAEKVDFDERLDATPTGFRVPSFLALTENPALIVQATSENNDSAIAVMQVIMLRFLTSFPPGKVRFTVIDPAGLGRSFSAYMHLADFDERLISERIWTEQSHINQRLAKLTEHMENVIQKNLRNEFATIREYNECAGEVTVPFHILVVAGFPINFSDEAAQRLAKIVATGPQCGVYTIIGVGNDAKMPRNFDFSDISMHARTLTCDDAGFRWDDDQLASFPLQIDSTPDDQVMTSLVREIGKRAKEAIRVEVPFDAVAPQEHELWTADSRDELIVPIGRSGAKDLQEMRLGKGTSQHVLIAGKTGSGKSTLLHILITNLSLHYSPEEVRFYLVDFKKGVEFKPYAEHELPHARVIAIESEREFGLSVLQKLDAELQRRGELFRDSGVQTVADFRQRNPDVSLPRLLLVIDEFQELFVKEDKIAHESALLLDRLIRQGRAFGMHVLLGSQSLSGAYTLARSTIGQMAVRIALQCSEVDARLILSDENDVARLLNRPGDAIYNDANGLSHGNHSFQVVWLSDAERVLHIKRLRALVEQRHMQTEPAIVFEGNAPADAIHNVALKTALMAPAPLETPLAPRAWLGNPVAIKEPPAAVFHRRTGNNLIVVGQQREAALGLLVNSLISLAAFSPRVSENDPRAATKFYVLDVHHAEPSQTEMNDDPWSRATQLGLDVCVGGVKQMDQFLAEINEIIAQRQESGDDTAPPVFLFVADMGRFRGLEPKQDDFGLSGFGDSTETRTDQQFADILRNGPPFGVHALVWCESCSQVTRFISRKSWDDLDLRVLMQMNANDSARLMDSPDASQLGLNRALLYRADRGHYEKFWPYQVPSREWWSWVQQQLPARFRRGLAPETKRETND